MCALCPAGKETELLSKTFCRNEIKSKFRKTFNNSLKLGGGKQAKASVIKICTSLDSVYLVFFPYLITMNID